MQPIILGAVVGFFIGLAGFIIVRFWIRPIAGYRQIKGKVRDLLREITGEAAPDQAQRAAMRKLSAELSQSHNDRIPGWYRIKLRSRGESPLGACGHLMALANTKNPEHFGMRVDKLKKSLNI